MSKEKSKSTVPAVTKAATLAGRAIARLESAAEKAMRDSDSKDSRSLKLLSQTNGFQALVKCGRTTIQFENDVFSIDIAEGGE